jgi:hypothetical protein
MRLTIVLGALLALPVAAFADAPPLPESALLPAPAVPDDPPELTIVSPEMDENMVGRTTRAPDDRYSNLECLQDAKKLSIKLAAKNWPMRGGEGVLLVVDGVYAKVLHNLSKPVLVAELEAYERISNSGTWAVMGPMSACGMHWIAAVPTAANGRMLPVAPVVSWWRNSSADSKWYGKEETEGARGARLGRGLPVVNWPLIGSTYIGDGWSPISHDRSGMVLRDTKHVVLDWTVASGTETSDDCPVIIAAQDTNQSWNEKTTLPRRGTMELPPAFVGQALAIDADKCGGMSEFYAMLYAKKPTTKHPYTWPKPGGAQADDYWHSAAGHKQFKGFVKSQRQKCDEGEADACAHYGHSR